MMYGSHTLSMLIDALFSLTNVALKICLRRRSVSTFLILGLISLIPLILATNATFASEGTNTFPAALVTLLVAIVCALASWSSLKCLMP